MATSRDQEEDPCNWLNEVKDAEVFVMYNDEDEYEISKYIFTIFKNNEVIYASPAENMKPGSLEFSAIAQAIRQSKKMLLILAKDSIKKFSFSLEILLAIEKCMQTNKLNLVILLKDGVRPEDIPRIPMLQCGDPIILENNVHERCISRVIDRIRDDNSLNTILPTGNMAAGMAWSHFTGYLEIVLPELAQGIRKSDWFNENPGQMPLCLFMLLPLSGRCAGSLAKEDGIDEVGEIEIVINRRQYSPKVFKVSERDQNNVKEYYCVAQYPGAFGALGIIHDEIMCMNKEERNTEVKRFHHYMNGILDHEKYRKYGSLAKTILYNDEEKSSEGTVSHQLLQGIKSVIKKQVSKVGEAFDKRKEGPAIRQTFNDEVCLLYLHEDENIVFRVRDYLTERRVRFSKACPTSSTGNRGDPLPVIANRISEARWTLLFITENFHQQMIDMFLAEILSIGIEENSVKVIPVLVGVDPTKLPSFINWTFHITMDTDGNYLDMLYDAIRGKSVSMKDQIPIGPVAYGLAWAFFVNYLRFVLPDLPERIKECQNREEEIKSYRKGSTRKLVVSDVLWQVIPKSCRFQPSLAEVDKDIRGPWRVRDVEKPLYAARRVFPCSLWRISTKDTDYLFAGEYFTPVKTLYNMHISMIAGLSYEQMMSQRQEMADIMRGLLSEAAKKKEYAERCDLIEYDDGGDISLSKILIDKIDKEKGNRSDFKNLHRWMSEQREEE